MAEPEKHHAKYNESGTERQYCLSLHIYEKPKVVKLINSERGSGCQEPEGGRSGGLLITGHKIPVKQMNTL